MGALTDTAIRKTEARGKAFKLSDGHGLHLFVSAAGGKLWRLKYRIHGREKLLSFGAYPAISLARARILAAASREALARGDDPGVLKADVKRAARQAEALDSDVPGETFSLVAELWFSEHSTSKNAGTAVRWRRFIDYTKNYIGDIPIAQVKAADLVLMTKAINNKGKHETARRTFSTVGRIFRYAVAHGIVERNPANTSASPAPMRH